MGTNSLGNELAHSLENECSIIRTDSTPINWKADMIGCHITKLYNELYGKHHYQVQGTIIV